MEKHFDSRKEALEFLEENALSCVTWKEKGVRMSAIYWSGKRRIQKANAPVNIQTKPSF